MDTVSYLRFVMSLVAVLALIFALTWAVRRWGSNLIGVRPLGRQHRRLAVVEALPLDARHRLVLIRRDDREHLILLGGSGTSVIERDCLPPHFLSNLPVPPEPRP